LMEIGIKIILSYQSLVFKYNLYCRAFAFKQPTLNLKRDRGVAR